MEGHLRLMLEANRQTNLTNIIDWDKARLLHLEDSLAGAPELEQAPEGALVDLGSGGGFPGIPLALLSGRRTTLVDSVKKKGRILKEIVHTLGLDEQIQVSSQRAEELAQEQRNYFSAVCARAVARLPVLMELTNPLLTTGGYLIAYKAQLEQEEREQTASLEEFLGMELVGVREFFLSDKETKRTIVLFRKKGEPQLLLPRRNGLAQKRPFHKTPTKLLKSFHVK
jgi:16S rRNA (guanine527-N7)-methyltransferase